ncbi:hypothetical protein EXIGLDRAFT_255803 [Exidia glandulosa HHB12029]|uniref:Uncharacterized protein n=1 Tax=Exidia glandulosa HHB12029 TaxID=1314781 RepID=A0A165DVQ9_EXIGL|nr:hypothetical protein EXIGLDRAFT_255803 [Exidia glandulosa HHB12029]
MRSTVLIFFSAIISAAPFVASAPYLNDTSPYDFSPLHEFSKRAASCGPGKGVELRGTIDDPKTNYGLTCRTQNLYPRAYTYNYAKRNVTSKTVFPADGKVSSKHAGPMASQPSDPWTCDHIIEIQIFGMILGDSEHPRKNSVCDIAASGKYTDWKTRLNRLKEIINGVGNVNYFTTDLEKIKGPATQAFLAANPHALHDILDAKPGERVHVTWGPNAVTGTTDLEWLAFEDYLKQTESRTKSVAAKMDLAIQRNFPGADAGTAKLW